MLRFDGRGGDEKARVQQGLLTVESRTVDFEKCCDLTAEAATKRHERSLEFDGGCDE